MTAGQTVRYYTKNGGWRFGTLIDTGYKWARVMIEGREKKIAIDDIKPWPPEKIDAPAKPVKRGRA